MKKIKYNKGDQNGVLTKKKSFYHQYKNKNVKTNYNGIEVSFKLQLQ